MCRLIAPLALLTATGCTSAGPSRGGEGEPLRTGAPLLAAAPEHTTLELGPLESVVPLDRGRALHRHFDHGPPVLSMWTETKGHVWKYSFDRFHRVPMRAVVTAGEVVVVPTIGAAVHGARGLDRATGAELWRVEHAGTLGGQAATPRNRALQGIGRTFLADADADGFVHAVIDDDHAHLFAYAAATGELRGAVRERLAPELAAPRVRFGATRVMLEEPAHARPAPDDPEHDGRRWTVLRRGDLTPVGHLDGHVPGEGGCLIGDRHYATDRDGLIRVALDRPGLPRELVLAGPPRELLGCDRRDDLDIIWLFGQVVGVPTDGGPAWAIDLEEWIVEREPERVQWLPAFPAVWAHTFEPEDTALLVLDLRRHRIAWVGLTSHLYGAVEHDRERTLVWRDLDALDEATSVVFTVDGETGLLGPALQVEGIDATRGTRALVDGTVWLADSTSFDEGLLDRRWPERWTRLDAATLRPLDGVSAFTLRDAEFWLRGQFQPRFELPAARPRRPRFEAPPRVMPARDRARGPEPPWDRAELDAAARAVVEAPADSRVWLLAWDVRAEQESEHAVVALEYVDSQRGPMWMVALLRRGDWGETFRAPGEPRGRAVPWHVYQSSTQKWPRRLLLTRRPTSGDIERLLDGDPMWRFPGGAGGLEVLVDGNVMDAAWREVTGEAPTRFYPREIERPGE